MGTNNNGSFTPIITYNNADLEKLQILKENSKKTGIYLWIHKESGNIYVGSAINIKSRLRSYYNINYLERNKTMHICNALQSYGYSAFSLSILEYLDISNLSLDETRKLIFGKEQYYLDLLQPKYNILKIAGSRLGSIQTEETKAILSEANKGENNPRGMLGKSHSIETLAKMSEAWKSINRVGEKNHMFGKVHSAETLTKMSEAHKGKSHTAETKTKMSITKGTVIFVYDTQNSLDNNFSSAKKAAKFFGCSPNTILSYTKNGKLFQEKWILSTTLKKD